MFNSVTGKFYIYPLILITKASLGSSGTKKLPAFLACLAIRMSSLSLALYSLMYFSALRKMIFLFSFCFYKNQSYKMTGNLLKKIIQIFSSFPCSKNKQISIRIQVISLHNKFGFSDLIILF